MKELKKIGSGVLYCIFTLFIIFIVIPVVGMLVVRFIIWAFAYYQIVMEFVIKLIFG